jgi:hypothetical protein
MNSYDHITVVLLIVYLFPELSCYTRQKTWSIQEIKLETGIVAIWSTEKRNKTVLIIKFPNTNKDM